MKIVSYNVNGLRPRLLSPPRTLAKFLDSLDADIICLQETKMARHDMTADIAVAEGYESFFSCTRTVKKGRIGYSGVATFCRVGQTPCNTSPILPLAADEGFTGLLHKSQKGENEEEKGRVGCYEEVLRSELTVQELLLLDSEGRCIITDHGSFVLFNLYCPRVECGDEDRMEFKMNFFLALQRRWEGLLKQNRKIIAVGDFNVSPYAVDSCAAGPNFDKHICRKWMHSVLKSGGGPFLDVFRFFHPERKEAYTCWSQSSGAEEFNFGTRIDLILATGCCNHEIVPELSDGELSHGFVECEVQDSDILSEFRRVKPDTHPRWQGGRSLKLEGSDHAPIFVRLKEQCQVEPHEVPPLAARFMPEIRGRQLNLATLLKRQLPPTNLCDAELERKLRGFSGAAGEASPSVGVKTVLQTRLVGRSKKTQGTSSSSSKKYPVPTVQKSDSQQNDLHKFFGSSWVKSKNSLVTNEINEGELEALSNILQGPDSIVVNPDRDPYLKENMDLMDLSGSASQSSGTDEYIRGTPPDLDVLGSKGLYEVENLITSDSDEQWFGQTQTGSDSMRLEQLNTERSTVLEQIDATERTRAASAVSLWMKIQEKMARAIPLCQGHDEPCVARVVKKPGPNRGRGFYVCARAEGPSSNPEARCDHFEWASSFKKGGKPKSQLTDTEQPRTFLRRIF